MKKRKKKFLWFIPTLLLLLVGLGIYLKEREIEEEKKNRYCYNTTCYTYYKEILKEYQIEDNKYIFEATCKECKVISHTKNRLVLEKNDNVYHYYKKNYKMTKKKQESVTGNAYKNEYNEIYFLGENILIIANEKGTQRKYTYTTSIYDDEYININVFQEIAYTYNTKTKEILGYQKVETDTLEKIDLSYYEEDGTIKIQDNVKINGAFELKNEKYNIELYVYQNKILLSNFGDIKRGEFKVVDANEKEIYLSQDKSDEIEFIYRKEENTLYNKNYEKYKSIETKDLQTISMDYFKEDTSLKEITISINGSYEYKEENVKKELLIKDGKITLAEYYVRYPDRKGQETYSYHPYTRNEEEITYYYEKNEDQVEYFKYNIKEKTITIYYDEYKKVKDSDLKYIK